MPSPGNCFNNEVIREPAPARRIARKFANGRHVLRHLTLGPLRDCPGPLATRTLPWARRRASAGAIGALGWKRHRRYRRGVSRRNWTLALINARSHAPRALHRDGENRLLQAAVHTRAHRTCLLAQQADEIVVRPPATVGSRHQNDGIHRALAGFFAKAPWGGWGKFLSIRRPGRAGSQGACERWVRASARSGDER
jgi:hypothetical protein